MVPYPSLALRIPGICELLHRSCTTADAVPMRTRNRNLNDDKVDKTGCGKTEATPMSAKCITTFAHDQDPTGQFINYDGYSNMDDNTSASVHPLSRNTPNQQPG
jgi:hypothetical protein